MPDVTFLSPQPNQCILTTHIEVLTRSGKETGVVNGNQVTASSPASLVINVAAGRIKIDGAPLDVDADTVTLDAAHETLPRVDTLYRDITGDLKAEKGTPAVIEDPKVLAEWKSYTSPQPAADIPAGAILGAVFIPAGATAITSEYIWMFAGGVGDVSTAIATPGVDTKLATEKAVRDGLDTRIAHALATAANDFLVASGSGVFVKKTLAEVKTILGLGTAAYTAVADYAVAAKGVTNGDTHDHQSGRGAAIAAAATVFSATSKILARKTTSGGVGEECSLSEVLDFIGSATRGDVLYRGASAWARLPKGTAGQVLVQGANDPAWTTRTFEVAFPFGDGLSVIQNGSVLGIRLPINCKVISADAWEVYGRNGTITFTVTKNWVAFDVYSISSPNWYYAEAGLNLACAAGEWLFVTVSNVTVMQGISLCLTLEAT